MNESNIRATGIDPMIDARQAAVALRLPYYWFADSFMRNKYRIPHYMMGCLVRYRLSELSVWAARCSAVQRRNAPSDGTKVEEGE